MGKPAGGRGNTGVHGRHQGGGDAGTNATLTQSRSGYNRWHWEETAQKIRQKIFPARDVLWHRKQLQFPKGE